MTAALVYFALIIKLLHPVPALIILSFAQTTLLNLCLASISVVVPTEAAGTAFGLAEVLDAWALLLGDCAFGFLGDITGGYTISMLSLLGMLCLGCLLLVYVCFSDIVSCITCRRNDIHYAAIL